VSEARGGSEFRLPSNAFGHTDASAMVMLEARMSDGSLLPPWLQFDSLTGLFRGTPPGGLRTSLEVTVTARDEEGREANLSFTLDMGVKAEAEAPVKAEGTQTQAFFKARNDVEEDAEADGEGDGDAVLVAADGTLKGKLEKEKPVKAGARPFSEQVRSAKAMRDPLLAKILPGEKRAGRSTL
jgi:hypothetical protein